MAQARNYTELYHALRKGGMSAKNAVKTIVYLGGLKAAYEVGDNILKTELKG